MYWKHFVLKKMIVPSSIHVCETLTSCKAVKLFIFILRVQGLCHSLWIVLQLHLQTACALQYTETKHNTCYSVHCTMKKSSLPHFLICVGRLMLILILNGLLKVVLQCTTRSHSMKFAKSLPVRGVRRKPAAQYFLSYTDGHSGVPV